MTSRRKINLLTPKALALLILIGLGLILTLNNRMQSSPTLKAGNDQVIKSVDAVNETALWKSRISQVGTNQAYQEFKNKYSKQNFGIQHYAAHVFGPLIYDRDGVKGVAVCDQTFAFGCYHSFFGRAISEKGLSIIPDLDRACLSKFGPLGTGCQHGLGHGLMEYFGRDQLLEALQACRLTTQLNPLFGCTSGVFMEYNVPIIIGTDNTYTEFRKLNPTDPYEPCDKIPSNFQKSCYYEMGQWWDKVYQGDYSKLGQLCQSVANSDYRDSCYFGVGNVSAPSSNYEILATISKCQQMPDPKSQITCRSGASWSFYAEPTRRSLASQVCEGLQPSDRDRCVKDSDLIGERPKS